MDNFITWAYRGIIIVTIAVAWYLIRREVRKNDERQKSWNEEGGLVTRHKYFEWCKDQQMKCPACAAYKTFLDWRNGMFEKGGVITRNEHTSICKEVTKEVADQLCSKLDTIFEHHREWVGQEMKMIRLEIKNALDNRHLGAG